MNGMFSSFPHTCTTPVIYNSPHHFTTTADLSFNKICIVLILLIGGGVGFFFYKKKNKRIDSTPLIDKPTPPPAELENMSVDNPFIEEKRTVVIIKASTDSDDKKNE